MIVNYGFLDNNFEDRVYLRNMKKDAMKILTYKLLVRVFSLQIVSNISAFARENTLQKLLFQILLLLLPRFLLLPQYCIFHALYLINLKVILFNSSCRQRIYILFSFYLPHLFLFLGSKFVLDCGFRIVNLRVLRLKILVQRVFAAPLKGLQEVSRQLQF